MPIMTQFLRGGTRLRARNRRAPHVTDGRSLKPAYGSSAVNAASTRMPDCKVTP
jgi:hypothetical protein